MPVIENATVTPAYNSNGVHTQYYISPNAGYVLHDNISDWVDEYGELKLGYVRGTVSCGVNYDFTANPREFYAVPEDSVPADQIFGVGSNDHVVA